MIFKLFSNRKIKTTFEEAEFGPVHWLKPLMLSGPIDWLALPKRDVPELVARYIAAMETEESAEWCRCLWAVHPDDQEIKKGHCRECNQPQKADVHTVNADPDVHKFKGKRMRKADEHPQCPVHTREGMVMYFLEWAFTNA
jgi:hypothetical protein